MLLDFSQVAYFSLWVSYRVTAMTLPFPPVPLHELIGHLCGG